MLLPKQLPLKLWAEAVNTAVYVLNLTGLTKVDHKTPFELWHNKTVQTDHLKNIWRKVLRTHTKAVSAKTGCKAVKGYLVGYT